MKGAKDSSIVTNNSRDIIENVELIDEDTLEEEEQVVPELETAVNVCYIVSFGPLICVILSGQSYPDPDDIQDSTFRSCEGAITAKEELLDVEKDVVDGHLHFHDEGVASLFIIDDKETLEVEVGEEELEESCLP